MKKNFKYLVSKYRNFFQENDVLMKVKSGIQNFGQKIVYSVLLLFYSFKKSDTPLWAKNIIIGVIGYVLAPIDSIPDLTPILGFTDDLGVVSFGLVTIACYIDNEVREKAKTQMNGWFNQIDEQMLLEVDKNL